MSGLFGDALPVQAAPAAPAGPGAPGVSAPALPDAVMAALGRLACAERRNGAPCRCWSNALPCRGPMADARAWLAKGADGPMAWAAGLPHGPLSLGGRGGTGGGEATLAAIVRELVVWSKRRPLSGHTGSTVGLFWPNEVAPIGPRGKRLGIDAVQRRLKAASYAEPSAYRDGSWRLTPAGLDAVDAARAAATGRAEAPAVAPGAGVTLPGGRGGAGTVTGEGEGA